MVSSMLWRARVGQSEFLTHSTNISSWESDIIFETMLASVVINHLQNICSEENCRVIYLFLEEADTGAYTTTNLYGSLLKQMIRNTSPSKTNTQLRSLYRQSLAGVSPGSGDILECLQSEISAYDRIYIIIDALDVCPSSVRAALETELGLLQREAPRQISLMFTARESVEHKLSITCNECGKPNLLIYHSCAICREPESEAFDLCQACKDKGVICLDSHNTEENYQVIEMEICPEDDDLKRYIGRRIKDELEKAGSEPWNKRKTPNRSTASQFVRICRKDETMPQYITSNLIEKAKGSLLITRLYMDELTQVNNQEEIYKALVTFPTDDLNRVYERTMQRIQSGENSELALRILARITSARRELTLEELEHVLATDPGDRNFNEGKRLGRDLILPITCGLVGINDDDASASVHALHSTLYEYLDKTRLTWFPTAELEMAKACLTYLNFDEFRKPCSDIRHDLGAFNVRVKKYPFIVYAAHYFGDHIRNVLPDPDIEKSALQLFTKQHRLAAVVQVAGLTKSWGPNAWDAYDGVEGIHLCAWFGLLPVILALEKRSKTLQLDAREKSNQQTPLMYACRRGHAEVVHHLIERGADINAVSAQGSTPMFEAILHNREKVVEQLVVLGEGKLDLDAIYTKEKNRTALMIAASRGGDQIIESLLEHPDIDIDKQDSAGFTALCLAADAGFGECVRALVDHECDVNLPNNSGYSPLFLAVMKGDCDMVNLLLQSDADPYLRDKSQSTLLQRAVEFGRINVVELLLKDEYFKEEDLDDESYNLLISACRSGHLEIVVLLKERGFHLDSHDQNGWTALHHAVSEAQFDVVQLLLEYDVDHAMKDKDGNTPLDIALHYGHPHIASLLKGESIDEQPLSPTLLDAETAPIWLLAKRGLSDILKQALATRRSELYLREPSTEYTPFHLAAVENHTEALRLLLEATTLDPTVPLTSEPLDSKLRSPLHLAALNGCLEATELLVAHSPALDIDIDCKDAYKCTPLYLTKIEENETPDRYRIAAALVEAGADIKYADVQKTLFAALEMGKRRAVQRLVDAGADVLAPDEETGQRAIHVSEDEEMVRILRGSWRLRGGGGGGAGGAGAQVNINIEED